MIKLKTLGAYEVAKMNPVLTSDKDVVNNTLYADKDGTLYLIANVLGGDEDCQEGVVIPKGEYLNAFRLDALVGLELEVDAKHVTGGIGEFSYDGTDNLVFDDTNGGLKEDEAKTGIHFVAVKPCYLTEKAVDVRICAPESGE